MRSAIVLTASTGVAACIIGGQTIHSWSGVGLGTEPIETICARVSRNSAAKKRWCSAKLLVIDEVSMLPASFFDTLSAVASRVRADARPFGGLQLILCGDFFQLPPVNCGSNTKFCFQSNSWARIFGPSGSGSIVILQRAFRQISDPEFSSMLNDIRQGIVSEAVHNTFSSKASQCSDMSAGRNPAIKLFSRRRDVDQVNAETLSKLEGRQLTFHSEDAYVTDSIRKQLGSMIAPQTLDLKIGAQVS
jgi:ATP-dependent DNA helicase PIF1